jgi:hypothetical protein
MLVIVTIIWDKGGSYCTTQQGLIGNNLHHLQPPFRYHVNLAFLGAIRTYFDTNGVHFLRKTRRGGRVLSVHFSIWITQLFRPWPASIIQILILSEAFLRQTMCILSSSPTHSCVSCPDVGPKGGSAPRRLRERRTRSLLNSLAKGATCSSMRRRAA